MSRDKLFFGLAPDQNKPFDDILEVIRQESELTGENLLKSSKYINRMIKSIGCKFNKPDLVETASLQIIGLTYIAYAKDELNDDSIMLFHKAVQHDPLIKNEERQIYIGKLSNQLISVG